MGELSAAEVSVLRGLNKSKADLDLAVVLATPFSAVIVGEDPGQQVVQDCPLLPHPRGSPGWRLWKMSGLGLTEYLAAFRRVNLCRGRWSPEEAADTAAMVTSRAAVDATPLVLLGSRVSTTFRPDLRQPFEWLGTILGPKPLVNMVRIPHPAGRQRAYESTQAKERAAEVLRQALNLARFPGFTPTLDAAMACGRRVSGHPKHPRYEWLRVVCANDTELGAESVRLPWGLP